MQDSFFAIRLILRYGNIAAIIFALMGALVSGCVACGYVSWFAFLIAPVAGGLIYILCKSYVELMYVVFHMLN